MSVTWVVSTEGGPTFNFVVEMGTSGPSSITDDTDVGSLTGESSPAFLLGASAAGGKARRVALGAVAAAGTSFLFTQASPASTWTVNHNLGAVPQTEVRSAGGQVVLAQVTHATLNQTVIQFVTPQAGTARFSL